MKRQRHNPAAFTLLEMVIVLVVLAIIVALAVPRMTGYIAGNRLNDTADELIAVARYGRAQAVNDCKRYRLNFAPDGHSYHLMMQDGQQLQNVTQQTADQLGDEISFAQLGTDFGGIFQTPADITLQIKRADNQNVPYIDFRPDSTCDPVQIKLTSAAGEILIECPSPTEAMHITAGGRPVRQ